MDRPKVRARLKELLDLSEGWDSYGADPIDPRAVDGAWRVLEVLEQEPAVIPCVDGGVQLEWHRAMIDLEIRITPTGDIDDD
jgi:hypothetical protein